MVLFWHNHFVTERDAVGDPRYTYRYAALLRTHALGNWKNLAREMSYDGAMLRYLNGNTNTRTSPNENYGRELLELFTIGKGPKLPLVITRIIPKSTSKLRPECSPDGRRIRRSSPLPQGAPGNSPQAGMIRQTSNSPTALGIASSPEERTACVS